MSEDFWKGYLTASIISLLMIFLVGTAARADVATLITKEALRQKVDPKVALAIAQIESSLNPKAVGPLKEIGLFQILPRYSPVPIDMLYEPTINIRVGIQKLKEAQKRCAHKDNYTYVICYNNGWRKPKYPYLHPYYKKFMFALRGLNARGS